MASDKVAVAILDDYQHVALLMADWSPIQDRIAIDVFDDTISDVEALAKRLQPYTIICAMRERTKFTAELLDKLPKLKLIATTGMVNRGIDVQYASTKGIVVSGTSSRGDSTLEHIWALLLATVRHVALEHANFKSAVPQWQSYIPLGLSGRTLGLVGVGRLGTATAKVSNRICCNDASLTHLIQIAKAFNLHVLGWSPNLTRARAEAAGVEFVESKKELLSRSDIVSIHMVLSDRTVGLINAEDFTEMKPTAFFINTSRGPIVDENALIQALRDRKIAGAGLDVFDIEPLPLDHPFRSLPNATITPHTGYVSDDNYRVSGGFSGCPMPVSFVLTSLEGILGKHG